MKRIESTQKVYDTKKLQIAPGVFDFTRADNYDEDITRHNLNYVKRPETATVVAPPLVKEIIKPPKPDFVKLNKNGLGEVNSINMKRVQMMKQQSAQKRATLSAQHSSGRRSEMTRVSSEIGSLHASSPIKGKHHIHKHNHLLTMSSKPIMKSSRSKARRNQLFN